MRKTPSFLRVPLLILWAVLLSLFTGILGAAPLRVLRQAVGGGSFWILGFGVVVSAGIMGLYFLATIFGIHILLIGLNAEFEERDFTLRQSAGFSILLSVLLISSGFYTWTAFAGKGWLSQLLNTTKAFLGRMAELNLTMFSEIKAEDIVVQIPSAVLIFLILSLGLSYILEKSISRWAGVRMFRREKLTDFTAPDIIIWFFIFSLLGAFGQTGVKTLEVISLNVLNAAVLLYFFQGLAVLGKYFDAFKVGVFWRLLWVVILVFQLPILLGLIGLVDYWADFRRVFIKRAAELKKKSIRE